ncbi:hypothetical protein JCM6882_005150 [Rhodosporidiobolus microsporus]
MSLADTSPLPLPFLSLHSRPPISYETCRAAYSHNKLGEILSLCITVGLVLSYLPQHARIIRSKNSEGFSPLFLLLGATSSASSLANIVTLQWGQVVCCQYLSAGQCFESVLGIVQVFVQWFCFNLIFVLYLLYYPLASKYVRSVPIPTSSLPSSHRKPKGLIASLIPKSMRSTTPQGYIRQSLSSDSLTADGASSSDDEGDTSADERAPRRAMGAGRRRFDPRSFLLPSQLTRGEIILSSEYRHAVSLFLLTLLHLLLTFLTTFILLFTLPKAEVPHPHPGPIPGPGEPGGGGEDGGGGGAGGGSGREHPQERAVRVWAATLGFVSLGLACVQYAPQLVLTARRRLVGSLSIPMMLLQTPGSFLFVYTLAIRPSVNYTAWLTYFVTGLLQGTLLVLCLIYKRRQAREGVDDWGRPVKGEEGLPVAVEGSQTSPERRRREGRGQGERSRLLE